MTRRSLSPLVFAALLLVAKVAAAQDAAAVREVEERAGEEEAGTVDQDAASVRTLAERIPSVTRRAFVKKGRLELFPSLGLTLNDPFYDHLVGTLGVGFHVLESLAVAVVGDYYGSIEADLPVVARPIPGRPEMNRPAYAGRLEVVWAPFYGKMSLFAEKVLHFDLYALVGGGMLAPRQGDPTFAGVVGIGQHFFFNEWVGLRIELRDQVYKMIRGPASAGREDLQHLLSFVFGVSLYLPPDFEREAL